MAGANSAPSGLPLGREVSLPGRGSTLVWDSGSFSPGHDAPLLLLHGWNVDAPSNFGFAFNELARNRRVVMFDQHGHGSGVRSTDRFSLDQAANDVVAVLDQLGLERVVVVGYSMGGAIAQLVALHAPDRCEGLVLMATAATFSTRKRERAQFTTFAAGAKAMRRLPRPARRRAFARISTIACAKYPDWILSTVQRADPVTLLEAGASLGAFDSREWAATLATPTAVVVTADDTVVPPRRQVELAKCIQPTFVDMVTADHSLPVDDDPRFARAIGNAVEAVNPARSPVSA